MDLQTQEKISKLMREQSEKLGKALHALRRIRGMPDEATTKEAKLIAFNTLREVADHGKDPKDL